MTSTEIIHRDGNGVAQKRGDIEALRRAIEDITTVEQSIEAGKVIQGLSAYARATHSLELVNQAIELRIWAERKGGEAVAKSGDTLTALSQHGVYPYTVSRWTTLYLTDEAFIRHYIEETKAEGKQLNVDHLCKQARELGRKRVAPHVYKEMNGKFSIEWTEMGRKLRRGGYKTREQAIEKQKQAQRLAPSVKEWKNRMASHDLAQTYGLLRRALDSAKTAKPSPSLEEALGLMYRAEDILGAEIRRATK